MIQIYRPIVWTAFVITLFPGILTARTIQKALSAAIHDYMPFGVNFKGLLLLFVFLNIIYQLVESVLSFGILQSCKKGNISGIATRS